MSEPSKRRRPAGDPFGADFAAPPAAQPVAAPPGPVFEPEEITDAEIVEIDSLPAHAADLPQPKVVQEDLLSDEQDRSVAAAPIPQPATPKDDFASLLDELADEDEQPAASEPAPAPVAKNPVPDWDEPLLAEPLEGEPAPKAQPALEAAPAPSPAPAEPEPMRPAPPELEDAEPFAGAELGAEPEPIPVGVGELAENTALWEQLAEMEDDDEAPPIFLAEGEDEEGEDHEGELTPRERPSNKIFHAEPELTEIDDEMIKQLAAQRPNAPVEEPDDDEDDEPAAEEEWQPKIYVAARQGMFAGANAVSIAVDPKESQDELDHALGGFAELQTGQAAFIRMSLRSWPGFRDESRMWLQARKTGQDPNAKQSPAKSIFAWVSYLTSLLWFHANKTGRYLGGSVPPMRPGARGEVKPLTASQVSDEEKQAWKDAEAKARDSAHFEVALRVGVVGAPDDQRDLERVADEIAAGFEVYNTPNQEIVWGQADPYDAAIGYMGTKLDENGPAMAMSAGELAELGHPPDDNTNPQNVRIRRSRFKQLPLYDPLICPDPYNPTGGMIPIGVINPRSEDARVIALDNAILDQHLFYSGRTGTGKALSLDTPIPTPSGWRQMGELREGDLVFDENGKPVRILQAFDVQHDRPCYEVFFSDGSTIVADADHKWLTWTRAARRAEAEQSPRSPEKPWVRKVQTAMRRDERLGRLQSLVSFSQMRRELRIPAYAIWRAYAAIEDKQERRVPLEQHYAQVTVVKERTAKLVTRAAFYEAIIAQGARKPAENQQRQNFPEVVTTAEILATLRSSSGHANHSIPVVSRELRYPRQQQLIDPYVLGAWLGGGATDSGSLCTADPGIVAEIQAAGYRTRTTALPDSDCVRLSVYGLQPELRTIGVFENKHIPGEYLRGSADQRWALLQGLLDTDGGVDTSNGCCEFYSMRKELAEQVFELAAGLGLQPHLREKMAKLDGREMGPAWTVAFLAHKPAFRLERKLRLQKLTRSKRAQHRYIVDVRPVESVPVRCIAVDSESHLYLAGKACIPTHNSELMKWLIFGVAKDRVDGHGFPLVVIDPHGALSEDVLNMLVVNCPERIKDIVFCDLSDDTYPVALNPLDIHNRDAIEPTVGSIMEMLEKQMQLGASGAPRARMFAQQAITALCWANLALKDPETKCTLLHVVTFFLDPEFRRLVMEFCENEAVREAFDPDSGPFENLSEKQQTEYSMPIIRAFSKLGASESFSAVFSAGENRLDFGKLISRNKIIIVKLARFSHQAQLGEFVGSLILPWMLSTMDDWGRKRDPDTGLITGSGCRIFVDEAPTLFGPSSSVPQVLAEARKWNLGLIFAAQMLSQFDKSVIDATLGNTATKISLGLEMTSASMISKSIAGASNVVTAGDIAELPNYHFYGNILQTSDDGRSLSGPFSAACLPVINGDLTDDHRTLRESVRQRSRELICNSQEQIRDKRKRATEDIKQALGELLREGIDLARGPLSGSLGGGETDYALDLDDDELQPPQGGWSWN